MLHIALFPCLSDNYGFLIHDSESGQTATIDTPDGNAITAALEARGWNLTAIWNTHHHFDHTGHNLSLAARYDCPIIGPGHDAKRIPGLTQGVRDGDVFKLGSHDVHVLETPGHTDGHIIFHIPDAHDGAGAAFVGDTIFIMGCGRLFEGTPAQMYESMRKIEALPHSTTLYCAHEYTLSNADFAKTVEPDNRAMLDYIKTAEDLRAKGRPTVPTTVARELSINPFMRANTPEKLGEIRRAKDKF
ncbi:hydroxyacylglutathione hydrolase [Fretibacter rubidus]|uniref:hydroxyacylglutathione hydrolase n=1 Tax=Fretibacter rubidus TaxID=570162 RepID=UPI00352A74E9